MPNSKELSVIIVNYASQKHLKKCLASLSVATVGIIAEVIIVNNDAGENLAKIMELFPNVQLLVNQNNVGFGTANNQGAAIAQGEILFFLNPDTEIKTANLRLALEQLQKYRAVAIVGAKLVTDGGQAQAWSAGAEVDLWDTLKNNLGLAKSRAIWESKVSREAAWVSGAALFVRKALFERLGGFDSQIFMYFEDVDLCQRARNLGQKVLYLPTIEVLHLNGQSSPDKQKQKKAFYASQDYYFAKHKGKAQARILQMLRKVFV